ncbi:hypothetical protein ES703_105621 [subsurface metagenome]
MIRQIPVTLPQSKEEVIVEITACEDCEKFIAIADSELLCFEAAILNLTPAAGHVPYLPGVDMPPNPYQYEFIIPDEFKDDPDPDVRGAATYLQAHDHKQDKRLRITRPLKGQKCQLKWLPYDYYRVGE